ncbi:MarR family winged helix-turn-helix transcriptional regulator [Planotetraspora kaengkrachanensis]|uniref:MarR family transcriptional regulator n=1 Tax=Planotetraspora kaengkrachanensis TaxID=575193 RepID=A0A8J3PS82_9ACTN|nr:MarR family transcriptional regulator [Planotetraspora kaengkrachanensis]GIG79174.1 MarR family transcriptional regulator [Planotetraspora kaengkrachanensis]
MDDSVDRHIARWRGKAPFDERVEAIVTRMQFLVRHLSRGKDAALAMVGLQDFEFETLHRLASRGEGGGATPSELAAELKLSPAGMTGRLDTLEKAGLVRRVRSEEDRRRVDVELTDEGRATWLKAMGVRGEAEDDMVGVLTRADQEVLAALLKRMLLQVEEPGSPSAPQA